jgi:hypothetical protein
LSTPPASSTAAGAITASQPSLRGRRRAVVADTRHPAQVVLCLIDLKRSRLARDPQASDSQIDVAGYAAVLREVS